MNENILAIDPGKFKSGIAVLDRNGNVAERRVLKTLVLADEISDMCYKNNVTLILIGNGGPSRIIEKKIAMLNIKAAIIFVNEKGSTLEARKLYWEVNKPKGLLRIIPAGLRIPHEDYDDFAAVVIAKRYLNEGGK